MPHTYMNPPATHVHLLNSFATMLQPSPQKKGHEKILQRTMLYIYIYKQYSTNIQTPECLLVYFAQNYCAILVFIGSHILILVDIGTFW